MALSVVDLYRDILPKTNCKECGFTTCLAFASMVVSEKHPIANCPHLSSGILERCEKELAHQYEEGKWLKRDLAEDALNWARNRAASMDFSELPDRIGGELVEMGSKQILKLKYFTDYIYISVDSINKGDGTELTRWEQVFLLNHLAQGGCSNPTGNWKGFVEFPNTVSKVKSMVGQVEEPLVEQFAGKTKELKIAALAIGGEILNSDRDSDLAILFNPLPKIPITLMFWDAIEEDGFEPQAKLMFDETITDHLDLESIVFLSERIRQLLCEG